MSKNDSGKTSGTDWDRLKTMPDEEIVYDDDAPRTDDAFWGRAVTSSGGGQKAILEAIEKRSQGELGPQKTPIKVSITILVDQRVLDYFKAGGKGWQTRLNQALVDFVSKDHAA